MAESSSLPKLVLGVRTDKKAFYRDIASMKRSLKGFVEFTNKLSGNAEIMRTESAQASKTLSATASKVKLNQQNTKELSKQTKELQRQGKEINKKIKSEAKFGKEVGRATNAANAQAKAMNNANKKTRLAATQLSYAIDDMQYGFRGVQNNIAQVALMMGAGGPLMIGITLFTVAIATLLKHQEGVLAALKGMDAALESFNRKARQSAVKEFSGELVKMIASLDLMKVGLLENHRLMDSFVKSTLKLGDGFTAQDIFDASMARFDDMHIQKQLETIEKAHAGPLKKFQSLLDKSGGDLSAVGVLGQMALIRNQTGETDNFKLFKKLIERAGLDMSSFSRTETHFGKYGPIEKEVGSLDKIEKMLKGGTLIGYLDERVRLEKKRQNLSPDEELPPDAAPSTGMTPMGRALSQARFQKALNDINMSRQESSRIYISALESALKEVGTADERLGTERAIAIEKAKNVQLDAQLAKSKVLDQSRKRLQVLEAIGGANANLINLRIQENNELIKSGQLSQQEVDNLTHQNELYDIQLKKIKDRDLERQKNLDHNFALMTAETPVQRAQIVKDRADANLSDILDRQASADEMQKQIDQLKEQATHIDKTTEAYDRLIKKIQELILAHQALVPSMEEVTKAEYDAKVAAYNLTSATEAQTEKVEGFKLNSMIATGAINAFADGFRALGAQDSSGILQSLLDPLGDFMIKLGKGLVMTGIGKEALSKLWTPGGGIAAIAAGAALIAGGSLIKAAQASNPAGGGRAAGSAGSAVDPVVAIPTRQQGFGMNKLEARVTGQDLRFILEKTSVSEKLYD